MSYSDESNSTAPKQTPNPRPVPTESAGHTGWLDALNSFLERAFLKADVDTGCGYRMLTPMNGVGGLPATLELQMSESRKR